MRDIKAIKSLDAQGNSSRHILGLGNGLTIATTLPVLDYTPTAPFCVEREAEKGEALKTQYALRQGQIRDGL